MKLYTVTTFTVCDDDRPRDFWAFPFSRVYRTAEGAKAECLEQLKEELAEDGLDDDPVIDWTYEALSDRWTGTYGDDGDTTWNYVVMAAEIVD